MEKEIEQKAVIYCRVSHPKQVREGHGLESQETRCREYAKHKGYEVVHAFHEAGITGKLLDRPKMQEMLAFLKEHKETFIVIIDDISRLARNIEAHIKLRSSIQDAGAKLESPSIEFGEDSDSRLVEHLLASVAAHQREKNAEQVTNRMRARALNGYWVASPVPGYRYENVSGHGKLLVRDEPVASIVQEALESFASGRFQTQGEVKRFLEGHEAYPKGRDGKVHYQRVKDLFGRVLYAGRLTFPKWGIHNHSGKHEALISFETWRQIQQRLHGSAKVPARKSLNEDFPLRNFVACSCGKPLTACWSKGRSRTYGYYLCQNKGCDSYGKSIKKGLLEGEFEKLLHNMRPSENLFAMAKEMFRELWERSIKKSKQEHVSIENSLVKIDRQVEQLLDRIIKTENDTVISAYEKRIKDLEEQKIVLSENIAKCGAKLPDFDKTYRTAFEFLENPHKLWASERFADKRTALKLAFVDRLVYDLKDGYRTAKYTLPFNVLGGVKCGQYDVVGPVGLEPTTKGL